MLKKFDDYKGVIIFYLLLAMILAIVSFHNKSIDMKGNTNSSYLANY